MILGLGIDLLETSRVERELSRDEWQPGDGIFTPEEINYCSSSKKPARRYAACFAAKEATLKALGIRPGDLALFREVEIGPETSNGYQIVLHDRLKAAAEQLGVRGIKLSVAHHGSQTSAVVMLED